MRKDFGLNVRDLRNTTMNDLILLSMFWVGVGAVWTYYADKKAYNEGMLDAIIMHSRGQLVYTSYLDESGVEMIDMEVRASEK